MEFFDEDRPRFVFKSRPSSSRATEEEEPEIPNKIFISISVTISLIILSLSFFYFESEPAKSLLLWLSLSLLAGPFAPSSLTGGKIRVGYGQILEPEQIQDESSTDNERDSRRKSVTKRSKVTMKNDNPSPATEVSREMTIPQSKENGSAKETKDWNEEDIEILKKQLKKHPAGKPGRWETVASAFGGKYKTENVIKKAKEIGEKKVYESDDYAQFLKNRKATDPRLVDENGENSKVGGDDEGDKETWSNGEDIGIAQCSKSFSKGGSYEMGEGCSCSTWEVQGSLYEASYRA